MTPGCLDPIETASRDELGALQLARLRHTLRHAYDNVAFYRRRFDENGVHPEDCASLADLARFPLTTKQDLRSQYPFGSLSMKTTSLATDHTDPRPSRPTRSTSPARHHQHQDRST